MKVIKKDLYIGLILILCGYLIVLSLKTFISTFHPPSFLNYELVKIFSFILGFIILFSIGDILSINVNLRVLGAFLLSASLFVFIQWHFFIDIPSLFIGTIVGLLIIIILFFSKNWIWLSNISILIILAIAIIYFNYIIFFYNEVGYFDPFIIIMLFSFILIFPIIIYPTLKSRKR